MRLTYASAVVIAAIGNGHEYGFDIVEATGLRTGTVYPILRRLELEKLVRSTWESGSRAREQARQARRNYRLTQQGQQVLREVLSRYRAIASQFGSAKPAST